MKKTTILLISIIIIASFLRLYNLMPLDNNIVPPALYPDEAMNGNNAVEAWENKDFKPFYQENFGREGLYMNIQALSVGLFGYTPWALRYPSALFGILTVLGLLLLTKELFKDDKLALLSSFLLATSVWHIIFSRIAFRAILAPLALTWAIYFLVKAFNSKRFTLYSALGGLVFGLGLHSYIAYRAMPLLVIVAFAVIYYRNREIITFKKLSFGFTLFVIGSIITFLPLGAYFLQHPQDFFGRTAGISVFNSETIIKDLSFNVVKTIGMFNVVGDFNWRHNIAGRPELFWPIGVFFLVGIFMSFKTLLRKNRWMDEEIILFSWLALAFLPVVISNEGLPHALRSILVIPPVFIFAGIGGMKIFHLMNNYINKKWLVQLAVWLFFSILIFEAYFSYFITWGQNPNTANAFSFNDYIISNYLNAVPEETPKYIVVPDINYTVERDNPISLQSILFLTNTFTNEKRETKNFFYLTKEEYEKAKIPENSFLIKL